MADEEEKTEETQAEEPVAEAEQPVEDKEETKEE